MFEQPTNQGNSNAQPGQAAPLVSPDTQPQTEAPVYVTKAEISALEEKLRKEMQQTAQSQADKVKNQINKKLETLKAAGITATPEQAQAMIQAEQSQPPGGGCCQDHARRKRLYGRHAHRGRRDNQRRGYSRGINAFNCLAPRGCLSFFQ